MLLALVVHARRGNIRVSEPLLPCFLKSVSYGYTLTGRQESGLLSVNIGLLMVFLDGSA
jgi:hypothetical protein